MISLSIKPQKILGLQTKRGMLGNMESYWSTKSFEKKLIDDGKFGSVEHLTSGLKETLSVNGKAFKDTDVTLVLDSSVYTLLRTDIPLETAATWESMAKIFSMLVGMIRRVEIFLSAANNTPLL
jgi:hypothetical protein